MNTTFFPSRTEARPMIYAYEEDNPNYKGYLKVGFASAGVEKRVAEQFPILKPGKSKPYRIVFAECALYNDGGSFTDKRVHELLEAMGIKRLYSGSKKTEWFRATVSDIKAAYLAVKNRTTNTEKRSEDFVMRPEQREAVEKTIKFYESAAKEQRVKRTPKFLWNAKMRFGKTFAAYQLAKRLGAKRVLVLTFKPAVQSAWREDLVRHVDFEGWQFISNKDARDTHVNIDTQYAMADKSKPIVVFGSFQDLLGTNENGGIKAKNEFIHADNWDLVIFDEYHFGAWRENAKKLFENPDEEDTDFDIEKYLSTKLKTKPEEVYEVFEIDDSEEQDT